jgi:hypothetical protein
MKDAGIALKIGGEQAEVGILQHVGIEFLRIAHARVTRTPVINCFTLRVSLENADFQANCPENR